MTGMYNNKSIKSKMRKGKRLAATTRVKSGNFGQRVNSDICLQTVNIQMRRLIKSRLIRIFTVCLVNLIFIPIIQK